jgi:hypothetical protein
MIFLPLPVRSTYHDQPPETPRAACRRYLKEWRLARKLRRQPPPRPALPAPPVSSISRHGWAIEAGQRVADAGLPVGPSAVSAVSGRSDHDTRHAMAALRRAGAWPFPAPPRGRPAWTRQGLNTGAA